MSWVQIRKRVQIRDVMGTDKEAGTDQGCRGYRSGTGYRSELYIYIYNILSTKIMKIHNQVKNQ